MNLDELVASIADPKAKANLLRWISDWKADESDVHELGRRIEHWHGNFWFKEASDQNLFHARFQQFKTTAIAGIGGMTVNERLYWFGLFEVWDNSDAESQRIIRRKLHAEA